MPGPYWKFRATSRRKRTGKHGVDGMLGKQKLEEMKACGLNQHVGSDPVTFRQWKEAFRQRLGVLYEQAEADSLFYWSVEEITGISKARLLAEMEQPVPLKSVPLLKSVLQRLEKAEPVQYVFGKAFFAGMELRVGPGVLIPRPETEELFQWACESLPLSGHSASARILDLCTGSGALALALAKTFPDAQVYACDLSSIALLTAGRNAHDLGLSVRLFQHDVLEGNLPESVVAGGPFQLMVSNPPYVLPSEKDLMRSNVLDYEPDMALFVDEEDPLAFYRALARIARAHLAPGGFFLAEINESFPRENKDLLVAAGFEEVEVRHDFRGKHRMVRARMPLFI